MGKLGIAKQFLFSSIFFYIGVFATSFVKEDPLLPSLVFFVLFLIFLFFYLILQKKRMILLFLIFSTLGVWRYSLSLPNINSEHISYHNGQEKELKLNVIEHPEKYNGKISFVGESKIWRGKILVYLRGDYDLNYGDELSLKCKLIKPEKIEEFSYDRYLALKSIYSVCYYPEILKIEKGSFTIKNIIYKLKNKGSSLIKNNLSFENQAMARAIILGEKKDISNERRIAYSRSGLSHIIAISGMHIGIFLLIISSSLYYVGMKRFNVFLISSFLMLLYLLLLDFPASATRASVMGILILWSFLIGRLNKIIYSLNLVAFIFIFTNPRMLRDDLGFIFSFLAVLGIVLFYEDINNLVKTKFWILEKIWQVVSISLSAQIFIIPLISYKFEIVSVFSPFSNLLTLWTLPFLLSFLLIALFFSFIPLISVLFFYFSEIIINYINLVVSMIAKCPYSFVSFRFGFFLLIFYYILLSFLILFKKKGAI